MESEQTVEAIAAISGNRHEKPPGLRAWELYRGSEGGRPAVAARGPAGKQVLPEDENLSILSECLRRSRSRVTFDLDADSDELIIRVVDMATGEVLRQVPPEEVRTIALSLSRSLGLVVDRRR